MRQPHQQPPDPAAQQTERSVGMPPRRTRLIWTLVALALAGATIWAVLSLNRSFSFAAFWAMLQTATPGYLLAALLAAFGFLFFEAAALTASCRPLGCRCRLRRSLFYAAADLYFSAITPSASGGQPASAYLMIGDGIPTAVATAALLANLSMYALSLLVVGVLLLLLFPGVFWAFDPAAKVLILIGYAGQLLLTCFFLLLLRNGSLLRRICVGVLRFLTRIRLLRRPERSREKLERMLDEYRESVAALREKRRMLLRVFLFNLLQRLSTISVTLFVALATGATLPQAGQLWVAQAYATIGANCIPIPGAMGVSDYLMLNGFRAVLPEAGAVNLELLSRSLSFYFVVLLCGALVLGNYLLQKRRAKR